MDALQALLNGYSRNVYSTFPCEVASRGIAMSGLSNLLLVVAPENDFQTLSRASSARERAVRVTRHVDHRLLAPIREEGRERVGRMSAAAVRRGGAWAATSSTVREDGVGSRPASSRHVVKIMREEEARRTASATSPRIGGDVVAGHDLGESAGRSPSMRIRPRSSAVVVNVRRVEEQKCIFQKPSGPRAFPRPRRHGPPGRRWDASCVDVRIAVGIEGKYLMETRRFGRCVSRTRSSAARP